MRYKYGRMLFAVFTLSMLLCGCVTKYDRDDIYEYVCEAYELTNVAVSRNRMELVDEEGYTDYVWEVTADGVKFRVLDNYGYGMESVTNYLTDDYRNVMLMQYYDENILPHFVFEENEENGLYRNQLVGTFATKEELIQLYEELETFHTYVKEKGYAVPYSFSYHLQMQTPIRNHMQNYIVDDGDSHGCVTNITEETVQEDITTYTQVYTDYHFNDLYEKFTEEEIKEAVRVSDGQIAIIKEGNAVFYPDLCASRFSYGVSFGTLFEILKREGFEVTGDWEHYTFVGANQDVYEISYDFINVDGKNDETNHYYYLKNGTPVKMDANFYNHFRESAIEEMCGLKLYIGKPEWYEEQGL